jgi:hypothetical protein
VLVPPLLLAAILIERWAEKWNSSTSLKSRETWLLTGLIAASLAIALFAKELTPLILIAFWPVWAWLRGRNGAHRSRWKPVAQACVGGLLALGFFILILMAWAKWRGFHWYDPLLLTKEKFFGRASGGAGGVGGGGFFPWKTWGWPRFLFLSYIPVLWLTAPLLFGLYWLRRAKGEMRFRLSSIPFSVWAAVGIFAAYTWLVQAGFYYPKYTPPAWPLLIFGLAPGWATMQRPTRKEEPVIILSCVCLFVLGNLEVIDPLLIIENRTNLNLFTVGSHLLGIAVPVFVLWFLHRKARQSKSFALVAGLLCYFVGIDASHLHRPYSTRYMYGERGFEETLREIRDLKTQVSPTLSVLSAARDIDWALQKSSDLLDFERLDINQTLGSHRIIVSRTYGYDSVSTHRDWLEKIERSFKCHEFVDTPGQRFEWWWKCDK